MEYRVLGSLEVLDDSGQRLPLGGPRQQAVLGTLLVRAGQTVPLQRLVDELWETPPETAAKTVQIYVSRLRRLLAAGAIETRSGGYALVLDGDLLDLAQFELLAEEGRAALTRDDWEHAAVLLREALALWRGPALGGLPAEALRREAERIEELHLQVIEDRLEADLGCGHERDVIPELLALVAEHPFRERLCAQLMLALYRTGRQTDALDVYRGMRTRLAEELGLEPSAELRNLERRVLAQDPELEPARSELPPAAAPLAPPARREPVRARRPVTVVFADVVDSVGLGEFSDAESVHRILERYSEIALEIVQRHEGEVEKFIGDAVVAFFGLTKLHEDDALRAIRAAVELREAVLAFRDELVEAGGIEFSISIGVNSGDVFVGGGAGRDTFATGDSVNVAARLEQRAEAWEILLGDRTYRLVEGAVRVEPLELLEVKGRRSPVRAWRLLELTADEAVVARSSPFVGREREREKLREVFALTREERTCRLCTIVGPAGIGKTRLAREMAGEASEAAMIAVGRCLSYGEAITYQPLIEIVRQLVGDDPGEGVPKLMGPSEESELVARRMRSLVGLSDETAPAEETFWAVRKLFEAAAIERPLIVGFEDVHWAEPLLLDLIEYLVAFSTGSALFLLCLARPELLESRPTWGVDDANRSLLTLEALAEVEARRLVQSVASSDLGPSETTRIVRTAEGNPLFLEQLVATEEERGGAATLPPSIQAVLAARIAGLEPAERIVLEHASVEGRNFSWSSVAAVLPENERETLGEKLMALVRRQLIQPNPSGSSVEDAFRFTHVLIQEAAYDGLPKEVRADLHERLARRLEESPDRADELVGLHLEQSYRFRAELGLVGEHERQLASEATARLEAAGHKAFVLGDLAACGNLLERAASLLPPEDPRRLVLLPTLGAALFQAGRLTDADQVLTEAIERSAGDELLEARASVEQQFVRLQAEPGAIAEAQRVGDAALAVFESHGDDLGKCRAWCLKASIAWTLGQGRDADEAWRRGAEHAAHAGEKRELYDILDWRASAAVVGPTPVEEAIEVCLDIRNQVRSSPVAVAETLHPLAALYAMRGEFEAARSLIGEGNALLEEFAGMYSAAMSHHEAFVEMLAGRPEVAEERLRSAFDRLEEMGGKDLLATTAAMLAQTILAQDRPEEALHFCRVSREAAAPEDLWSQVDGKGAYAKIVARRGSGGEAERLAREAVELAASTDFLTLHGDAFLDLATVLEVGGQAPEAVAALNAGLELYERKGNLVSAERARTRLEQVRSA
jgi:DNA-binding SARP family transcriptional activator/Flp pilus assembly protein TadD